MFIHRFPSSTVEPFMMCCNLLNWSIYRDCNLISLSLIIKATSSAVYTPAYLQIINNVNLFEMFIQELIIIYTTLFQVKQLNNITLCQCAKLAIDL
jgi:hypothetical protein